MTVKLAHVISFIDDIEPAVAFYRDALGVTPRSLSPSWVELDTGTTATADAAGSHAGGPQPAFTKLKIADAVADPESRVVLYCGGGGRSALAADSLQKLGYARVASLAGGFRGWRESGRPVDSDFR